MVLIFPISFFIKGIKRIERPAARFNVSYYGGEKQMKELNMADELTTSEIVVPIPSNKSRRKKRK